MRTNQFEVSTKLDGLVEKFRVLNRDDLADELYYRMRQLENHQQKWIPDVLDLLLHISDNPVKKSNVVDRDGLRQEVESPPPNLRWADIDREDPFDRNDPIWRDTIFAGYSSEEDGDVPPPSSSPSVDSTEPSKTLEIPTVDIRDLQNALEGEELVSLLKQAQFWNSDIPGLITVGEAEIVRETVFVLLGLPSSVYWRVGNAIELDKRFVLSHASHESLLDLESKVSELVLRIDVVRNFVRQSQTAPVLRVLQDGVCKELEKFDRELSTLQSKILTETLTGPLSLLSVLQEARERARILLHLAELVKRVRSDQPTGVLDALFNFACRDQALGHEDRFNAFGSFFVKSFERYLGLLQRHIEEGDLHSKVEQSLPDFMRSTFPKIKKISRMLVLLGDIRSSIPRESLTPEFKVKAPDLVPFQDAFELSFNHYLDTQLMAVASTFKGEVSSSLRRDLDALQHIYFARDAAVTAALDHIVFYSMNKDTGAWNDRFILTDHMRSVYGKLRGVDTQRLVVRPLSKSHTYRQTERLRLGRLENMSVIYYLMPPVSTIIPMLALTRYQKISALLLQLRWAKFCLESTYRHKVQSLHLAVISMRHLLLFSVNTIYAHFTSYSTEALTIKMFQAMEDGLDVDDMVRAHESFLADLEDHCLLSEKLAPLHGALLSILGLCGQLSDNVRRNPETNNSEKCPDYDILSSSEDESDTEGPAALQEPYNASRNDQLLARHVSDMKTRFDKHMAFLVAGLKGGGRVQNSGWDMLAEKLDWVTVKRRKGNT